MIKQTNNPFAHLKLEKEEKSIENALEKAEFVQIKDLDKRKKLYKGYAAYTLTKLKNINIRISLKDLQRLKVKAAENGLPYQTLVSTILHQYSNNKVKVQI